MTQGNVLRSATGGGSSHRWRRTALEVFKRCGSAVIAGLLVVVGLVVAPTAAVAAEVDPIKQELILTVDLREKDDDFRLPTRGQTSGWPFDWLVQVSSDGETWGDPIALTGNAIDTPSLRTGPLVGALPEGISYIKILPADNGKPITDPAEVKFGWLQAISTYAARSGGGTYEHSDEIVAVGDIPFRGVASSPNKSNDIAANMFFNAKNLGSIGSVLDPARDADWNAVSSVGDKFFYNTFGYSSISNLAEGSFNITNIQSVGHFFLAQTFYRNSQITSLPAGSFDTRNIVISTPVNDFFRQTFSGATKLSELPGGSFQLGGVEKAGNQFFIGTFGSAPLTELPEYSFNTGNISGAVGTSFFAQAFGGASFTELPSGSFDISGITDTGLSFFGNTFSFARNLAKLPDGSFNTSNIKTVEEFFVAAFHSTALKELPAGSFDTSNIENIYGSFLSKTFASSALTSLPEGSFRFDGMVSGSGPWAFESTFLNSKLDYDSVVRFAEGWNSLDFDPSLTTPSTTTFATTFQGVPAAGFVEEDVVKKLAIERPTVANTFFDTNLCSAVQAYPTWGLRLCPAVEYFDNGASSGVGPDAELGFPTKSMTVLDEGTLARPGYTFKGWGTSAAATFATYQPGGTLSMPKDGMELYAVWGANPQVSLSYEGNGVTEGVPSTQLVLSGLSVKISDKGSMDRPGYDFLGWSTDMDATDADPRYAPGTLLDPFTAILRLYAVWEPHEKVTLSYDGNGATEGVPTAQEVLSGQSLKIADKDSMIRPGYEFLGWSTDKDATEPEEKYAPNTTLDPFTASVDLYAVWTANDTVTLSYSDNGATSGSVPYSTVLSGQSVVVADGDALFRPGYTFIGWSTEKDATEADEAYTPGTKLDPFTDSTDLYAVWQQNSLVSLSYDGNGATGGVPTDQTVPSGQSVTVADQGSMTRAGYTFAGWNTDKNATEGEAKYTPNLTLDPFTASVGLYAVWKANAEVTVSYEANGAERGTVPPAVTVLSGQSVTVSNNVGDLARDGYTFLGWSTDKDATFTDGDYGVGTVVDPFEADLTLYAVWGGQESSVSFDANAGAETIAGIPAEIPGVTGQAVQVPDVVLERDGYSFVGWNTQADGTGVVVNPGSNYVLAPGGSVLYAQWSGAESLIRYDANGGTGSVPAEEGQTGNKTKAAAGTNLSRPGYTFVEWNDDAEGNGKAYPVAAALVFPVGEMTLYAQWEAQESILTFDANADGVLGLPADITGVTDDEKTIPAGVPTRDGFIFQQWNTQAAGGGTAYQPGDDVILLPGGMTLFAIWKGVSPVPEIDTVTDLGVTGKGVAGATITITGPEGVELCTTTVNAGGTWSCDFAEPQGSGTKFEVIQTLPDMLPSAPVPGVVPDRSQPPVIDEVTKDQVTGKDGVPGSEITVTDPETGDSLCKETSVMVNADGSWTCTLNDDVAPDTDFEVIAKEDGKLPSDPITGVTPPAPGQSEKPVIDEITKDKVTGKDGTPGAIIEVTDPQTGEGLCQEESVVVQVDGTWTCTFKDTVGPDTEFEVIAKEAGKLPSDPATGVTPPAPETSRPPVIDELTEDKITGKDGVAGSEIVVTGPGGVELCTTTVAADGTWSCDFKEPQDPGTTIDVVQKENGKDPSEKATGTVPESSQPGTSKPPTDVVVDENGTSGKGEPGAEIVVTGPGGENLCKEESVVVDQDGNWTCEFKEPQDPGTKIDVVQKEEGKDPSEKVTVVVPETDPDKSAPPTDVVVDENGTSGKGEPGAEIVVTGPGGENLCKEESVVVDQDGNWTCEFKEPQKPGTEIDMTQKEEGKDPSDKITVVVPEIVPETSKPPVIDEVTDEKVTGKDGQPGAEISVVDPETGENLCKDQPVIVKPDGTWSCEFKKPQEPGSEVEVSQKEDGKLPSGKETVTIPPLLEKSEKPQVSGVSPDKATGSGVVGAEISVVDPVTGENLCKTTPVIVGADGMWSCEFVAPREPESKVVVTQVEDGKAPSEAVEGIVKVDAEPFRIVRYSGADRYGTSLDLNSRRLVSGGPVFVATGANFPDSLSAGPAVVGEGGSLVLSNKGLMKTEMVNHIVAAAPSAVYIIGGTGAISKDVEKQLTDRFPGKVNRVGGVDRYETSAMIADRFFGGKEVGMAFVASGENFPDALTAAAAGGALGAPVLLARGGQKASAILPRMTQFLNGRGVKELVIAGGDAAVGPKLQSALGDSGFSVTRRGGVDRYETNLLVNALLDEKVPGTPLLGVWLAAGANFPDALSAAVPAGSADQRLVLSKMGCVTPKVVDEWIFGAQSKVNFVGIVGGNTVLNPAFDDKKGLEANTCK